MHIVILNIANIKEFYIKNERLRLLIRKHDIFDLNGCDSSMTMVIIADSVSPGFKPMVWIYKRNKIFDN